MQQETAKDELLQYEFEKLKKKTTSRNEITTLNQEDNIFNPKPGKLNRSQGEDTCLKTDYRFKNQNPLQFY